MQLLRANIIQKIIDSWRIFSVLLFFLLAGGFLSTARGAGLLIADGGFGGVLKIEEHDVHVTINNGVAVTRVTQVFRNTEDRQVEALYSFPVPKNASVSNFSMWINGKEMVGEVLEKERAREIYQTYKQQARPKDPGLLEQVDYKKFDMRIFPINPGALQRVQITYYQELDIDHDRAGYVYPLATTSTGALDSSVQGRLAFQAEVKSPIAITALDSPSHAQAFVVVDHGDFYKLASLEQQGGALAEDIVITYALARPQSGLDLLTSRAAGQDGFFYMTLTAGSELEALDEGMDYVFVLDISGSMANDGKLLVSRQSVSAFIDALDVKDRFDVMTFNVQPRTVFGTLRAVDDQTRRTVHAFLDSQQARGGTVLAPALTTAYQYGDPDRPLNIVLLSDGMTEQAEVRELTALIEQRPRHVRVFCIGIGNEINRPLLGRMADTSGGLAAFISNGDDFKRQAQAFRRKLMRPAVSDLNLRIDGVRVYDVMPARLPNLYHGSPLRIYGRYQGQGEATLNVTGSIQGKPFQQAIRLPFPAEDKANPEIERMWAMKKVDDLLSQSRSGSAPAAVVEEIVRLGEEFSIVSEHTSFLVLENDAEYQRWRIERRNLERLGRDRQAQEQRQRDLRAIRDKAAQDLGPQAVAMNRPSTATPDVQTPAVAPAQARPLGSPVQPGMSGKPEGRPDEPRPQSRNVNFGGGSGPVGPLFVGLTWILARRKRNR